MFAYSEEASSKLLKVLSSAGRLAEDLTELNAKGISAASYLEGLLGEGKVKDDVLSAILAKGYSLRQIRLNSKDVDRRAYSLLTSEQIEEFKLIPFQTEGKFLKVGVVDPAVIQKADQLKSKTQLNNEYYLISITEFETLTHELDDVHGQVGASSSMTTAGASHTVGANSTKSINTANSSSSSGNSSTPGAQRTTTPTSPHKNSSQGVPPTAVKPRAALRPKKPLRTKWSIYDQDLVIDFCDQILRQAIAEKCSDIHIESFRDTARVRMRFDGSLRVVDMYTDYIHKNYQAVTSRFKILAGCDISEKRLTQDGAITITDDTGRDVDFRFNLVPTKNGERIVMRILAGDQTLPLEEIGFSSDEFQTVLDAITAPQGMIIITGPTGSGKTTTLYSALHYINSPDINILTVEDPVEYYLEGAAQVQVNEKIGLTFSEVLRSFLRQDPEVILVGEIRDQETIDIAFKAALTGHLLFSTLHTNDSISSISRMINMGIPNFLVASGLTLVIAQRLARKNCSLCLSEDTRVTPELLLRIGFTKQEIPQVVPKRGMGCATCNGLGMRGRRAIYEILKKTSAVEDAILNNATGPQILEAARRDGFKTMQEKGRELIRAGVLSVEEYQRTLILE